MDSSDKLWAIGWICVVALFTSSTGLVWPLCLAGAIVAVAFAPSKDGEE